jgi:hypothetical protein
MRRRASACRATRRYATFRQLPAESQKCAAGTVRDQHALRIGFQHAAHCGGGVFDRQQLARSLRHLGRLRERWVAMFAVAALAAGEQAVAAQ